VEGLEGRVCGGLGVWRVGCVAKISTLLQT
jgi:hypothetical protein